MAIVKFGPTVIGIRGTIGGVTFSANSTAAYAKQWSRPPASRTSKQVETRNSMVENAQMWTDLSDAEKLEWNVYAGKPAETDFDPWGFQRFLSGFQWFCRAQQRRSTLDLVNPGDSCEAPAPAPITGLVITVETGTGDSWVTWDDDIFDVDDAIIMYLAFSPNTGAADAFRNWKMILALQNPPNGGVSFHALYQAAFGNIPAGFKCFCLAYKQHPAGDRSTLASTNAMVT